MPYIILNSAKVFPDFGSTSNWCAIGGVNPMSHVKLKLMRVDSSSSSVTSSSGNTQFGSITDPPSSLTVGKRVYAVIYNAGSVILAEGIFTILSYGGGDLVVDCPFPAASDFARFSFIDDYANFYFRAEYIYDTDVIATSRHTPSPDMVAWVNVTPFTRHLLSMSKKAQPSSGNNDILDGVDAQVEVIIYEVYDGPDGHVDQEADGDNININLLNAANQIGNPLGISLADKITNTTPSQLLKFLRAGTEPTYFAGFPFHLSFIYSSLLAGLAFDMERLECDTNGSTLASTDQAINDDHIGHVNRLFFRGSVIAGTDHFKITLRKNSDNVALSETLKVRYGCSGKNPVYLKWFNLDGTWSNYVFSVTQIESIDVTAQQGLFERFVEDLALADTDSDFITKEAGKELAMGVDGIDVNDCNLLAGLLYSPKVYMLTNPDTWLADGEKYITVKARPGKFKLRETNSKTGSVSLSVQLPQRNIQVQ